MFECLMPRNMNAGVPMHQAQQRENNHARAAPQQALVKQNMVGGPLQQVKYRNKKVDVLLQQNAIICVPPQQNVIIIVVPVQQHVKCKNVIVGVPLQQANRENKNVGMPLKPAQRKINKVPSPLARNNNVGVPLQQAQRKNKIAVAPWKQAIHGNRKVGAAPQHANHRNKKVVMAPQQAIHRNKIFGVPHVERKIHQVPALPARNNKADVPQQKKYAVIPRQQIKHMKGCKPAAPFREARNPPNLMFETPVKRKRNDHIARDLLRPSPF